MLTFFLMFYFKESVSLGPALHGRFGLLRPWVLATWVKSMMLEVHEILENVRMAGIFCTFRQVETMVDDAGILYHSNAPIFSVMQIFVRESRISLSGVDSEALLFQLI